MTKALQKYLLPFKMRKSQASMSKLVGVLFYLHKMNVVSFLD